MYFLWHFTPIDPFALFHIGPLTKGTLTLDEKNNKPSQEIAHLAHMIKRFYSLVLNKIYQKPHISVSVCVI